MMKQGYVSIFKNNDRSDIQNVISMTDTVLFQVSYLKIK